MVKAIRASVLVLLLACSAQAGWIQNESPKPPSPQPASTVQEPTDAQQPVMQATTEDGTQGNYAQIALELLALLPSLL